MTKRDFARALRDADEVLAEHGMPAASDARVRRRLRDAAAPRPRRAVGRRLLLAAGAAAILVGVGLWWGSRRMAQEVTRLGSFVVVRPGDLAARVEAADVVISSGRGSLHDPVSGWTGDIEGPARLKREASGVRLVLGRLELRVEKRAHVPVRLLVSDGAIEVLGTHFTVHQREAGGQVVLHEGSIRFLRPDGRSELISPGQTLSWPEPAPPLVPAGPDGGQLAAPPAPAPDLEPPLPRDAGLPREPRARVPDASAPLSADGLLERLSVLRSRGQYAQAVAEIDQALRRNDLSSATSERLSYEKGSILGGQLGDGARACAHWRRHEQHFPAGRYQRETTQARARLGCP